MVRMRAINAGDNDDDDDVEEVDDGAVEDDRVAADTVVNWLINSSMS